MRGRPASRLRSSSGGRPALISSPHGSMAGRSGVNSRTRPATPARIARSSRARPRRARSSAPASLASTSAGVRAPTSAVLIAGWPSTQASAIWLSGTPRGSATSRRSRSTTATLVLKLSPRKIGWPKATPLPRQSRAGSKRRGLGEGAGEQAVAERAVAHHADAVAPAVRERLLLLAPVEHVVADLRDVHAAGAHALGEHGAGEVRHADEARAAGGHDLLERAHASPRTASPASGQWTSSTSTQSVRSRLRLASTSARMLARLESRSGPGWPGGRRLTPHLVTRMTSRRRLSSARATTSSEWPGAVGRRGVHAVHAAIERAVDGLDRLVVLDGAVAIAGHRPAAEAHHGHLQPGAAERAVAHDHPRRGASR